MLCTQRILYAYFLMNFPHICSLFVLKSCWISKTAVQLLLVNSNSQNNEICNQRRYDFLLQFGIEFSNASFVARNPTLIDACRGYQKGYCRYTRIFKEAYTDRIEVLNVRVNIWQYQNKGSYFPKCTLAHCFSLNGNPFEWYSEVRHFQSAHNIGAEVFKVYGMHEFVWMSSIFRCFVIQTQLKRNLFWRSQERTS